jgi:hypothetical protein
LVQDPTAGVGELPESLCFIAGIDANRARIGGVGYNIVLCSLSSRRERIRSALEALRQYLLATSAGVS